MLNPNKLYCVYKHVSPSGKQYVGITCKRPEDRWDNGRGYIQNKHFWSAIQKYGWQNFKHEILATGLTMEDAVEMETRLIKEFDLTNPENGYNISSGGEVGLINSCPWTEERRKSFGKTMSDKWKDYGYCKKYHLTLNRNKGKVYREYLNDSTLDEDWLDYDPLNPNCGENICKAIHEKKVERFYRGNKKNRFNMLSDLPFVCYGLSYDLENLLYHIEDYDRDLFYTEKKVAVYMSKEGDFIRHYDYVFCPDGRKHKVFDYEDIEELLSEWQQYCEDNWLSPGKNIFDPESKIKFMLDGVGNILLRNHMDGIQTEYQKMKTGKYEIPLSACTSLFGDEFYSERPKIDNGEEESRMVAIMDDLAEQYDEAKEKKRSKSKPKKPPKVFAPTRRQKIEKARAADNVVKFEFVRVDTENNFSFDGKEYHIPESVQAYQSKITRSGEEAYDMDKVLCGKTSGGEVVFYDMNIEKINLDEG